MDEITLDDKTYVSSKRAAQITGYAKDYVGQLCREGRVEARLVGRNWYILESSIREHRFGKETAKDSAKAANSGWESPNYVSESVSALPTIDSGESSASLDHSHTVQEMQNAWQDWFSRKNEQLPPKLEEDLLESPEIIEAREEIAVSESIEEPRIPQEDATEVVHVVKMIPETPRAVVEAPPYQPDEHRINNNESGTFEDEEEVVPIHRSFTPPVVETAPRAVYQPMYTPPRPTYSPSYASPQPEGRIVRERKVQKKRKPSVALQALFLTLAGVAIAVALIGSGEADTFLNQNRIQYAPINFLGGESIVNGANK